MKKKIIQWNPKTVKDWIWTSPKWSFGVSNGQFVVLVIMFLISWKLHIDLFMPTFSYQTPFYPTWTMGYLTCWAIFNLKKTDH